MRIWGFQGILWRVFDSEFFKFLFKGADLVGTDSTEVNTSILNDFTKQINIYANVRTSVETFISEIIKRNPSNPPNKVVFCGHSLGGALSQIAAVEYASTLVHLPIVLVCYGSPKVGDTNFVSLRLRAF